MITLDGASILLLARYVQTTRTVDLRNIVVEFDLHFDDLKRGRLRRIVLPRVIRIEVDPNNVEPIFYQALKQFKEQVV